MHLAVLNRADQKKLSAANFFSRGDKNAETILLGLLVVESDMLLKGQIVALNTDPILGQVSAMGLVGHKIVTTFYSFGQDYTRFAEAIINGSPTLARFIQAEDLPSINQPVSVIQ